MVLPNRKEVFIWNTNSSTKLRQNRLTMRRFRVILSIKNAWQYMPKEAENALGGVENRHERFEEDQRICIRTMHTVQGYIYDSVLRKERVRRASF